MNLYSPAHQNLKKDIETVNMVREPMNEKDQSLGRGEWLTSSSSAYRSSVHGRGISVEDP